MAGVARRIALFDPARRLGRDLIPVAAGVGIDLVEITRGADLAGADVDAILVAPAVATELPPSPDGWPPRWIVGDASHAGKLAGAAASAQAVGVLLAPVTAAALEVAVAPDPSSPEQELARTRGLIAASVMDATPATLAGLAETFSASDCIVWWRDGETMTP